MVVFIVEMNTISLIIIFLLFNHSFLYRPLSLLQQLMSNKYHRLLLYIFVLYIANAIIKFL